MINSMFKRLRAVSRGAGVFLLFAAMCVPLAAAEQAQAVAGSHGASPPGQLLALAQRTSANSTTVEIRLSQQPEWSAQPLDSRPDGSFGRLYVDIKPAQLLPDFVSEPYNDERLKNIRVAQHKPKVVRVVFDLADVKHYDVELLDSPNRLVVTLYTNAQSGAETAVLAGGSHAGPAKGRAGAKAGRNGHAAHGAQSLLVDITVNGSKLPGVLRAEKRVDGSLALPREVWQQARLLPAAELVKLPDNLKGYVLDHVPGLTYRLDAGKLNLEIDAPASAFETTAIASRRGSTSPPQPAPPGFYLNYDLSSTHQSGSPDSYGAFAEGVLFNGWGSLLGGAVARGNGSDHEVVRTEAYFRKDLPGNMETLIIGDTVGIGGAWSRPARYSGIRWARDFSLRPGYITYPLPSLSGSAALPSTVDVLINDQRRQSQAIEPGPFELTNVPIVTGAGDINLVVRDILGNETLLSQRFYASPRLLAPGLHDFSLEAGFLRENYGYESNDYGSFFAAGTWREGLSNHLTAEGRLELQRERQAAGVELAGLLGQFAVARAAIGYSRSDDEQGGHYLLGIERNTRRGGGSLQWQYFDRDYEQFAAVRSELRPKERMVASVGGSVWRGVSVGASYIRQSNWDDEGYTLGALNMGFALPWNLHLSAYANKRLDQNEGWSGGLNLTVPLGNQRSASASSRRDQNGDFISTAEISQSPPIGPGLGWRLRASDDPNQKWQAGTVYNSNVGRFSADANKSDSNDAIRLGASGSLGWLEGLPFATRRIGHGSFAVVKVADIEDVPVYRSNQVAARTNQRGLAFVPGMLPYQDNKLSIDAAELPLNAVVSATETLAVPYARSGMLVEFPVRRSRNALVILRLADGSPVPAGARVQLLQGATFLVGKRGEVYLSNVQDNNRLQVSWRDGSCATAFSLSADSPEEPRIGPLSCH